MSVHYVCLCLWSICVYSPSVSVGSCSDMTSKPIGVIVFFVTLNTQNFLIGFRTRQAMSLQIRVPSPVGEWFAVP